MSNVAISDLPVATVINATDIIPFVQPAVAGTTKTITKTLLFTSPTMVTPNIGAATGTSLALTGLATVGTTLDVTGVSTLTAGAVIQGMTVGLGSGAVATNTAVGVSALQDANTGSGLNVAIGYQAGYNNLSASSNVYVGAKAGFTNETGLANTYVGFESNSAATGGTGGFRNVGIGYLTLEKCFGSENTAIGTYALQKNTSANYNTAIGIGAGIENLIGGNNFYGGYFAGYYQKESNNTAIGHLAYSGTSGQANDGQSNVAIGVNALKVSYTGNSNTAIGYGAGSTITTGTKNTIIGAYSGNQGGLDISTASNYIVLSDGDGNPRAYWNGANATFNGSLAVSEITGTTAAAATIASAATIAPTKSITFISGTAAVVTITAIAPFTTGGGTITLIPTGIFTWTTAGNIAVAGTAVVSRALTMTYDSTTTKWYPSYV